MTKFIFILDKQIDWLVLIACQLIQCYFLPTGKKLHSLYIYMLIRLLQSFLNRSIDIIMDSLQQESNRFRVYCVNFIKVNCLLWVITKCIYPYKKNPVLKECCDAIILYFKIKILSKNSLPLHVFLYSYSGILLWIWHQRQQLILGIWQQELNQLRDL